MPDNEQDPQELAGVVAIAAEQLFGTDAVDRSRRHQEVHLERQKLWNALLMWAFVVAVAAAPALVIALYRWALP